MRKKNQHSYSSVISINPYKNTYLSGISSYLSETSSPEFSKEQFVISYLKSHLQIPKNNLQFKLI